MKSYNEFINEMNRSQALKKDKYFYVDEEDGDWFVFGEDSGFSYGTFSSESQAEKYLKKLNKDTGKK